ncbi:MAG: O-antigen ligase family protein [Ardenticatenaceae bacterium]|nr:O-antigen ligase family protein [Ardenticatenaceae bacterium]
MKIDLKEQLEISKVFFLGILLIVGAWTFLQPYSTINSIGETQRSNFFYWKNVLGVALVIYCTILLGFKVFRREKIYINLPLTITSFLFPVYVLFLMVFRSLDENSAQETALYFLWFYALVFLFPLIFDTVARQKKLIWVILIANLSAIFIGIYFNPYEFLGKLQNPAIRLDFDFFNPNFYAYSWQIVVASALVLLAITRSKFQKVLFSLLIVLSVLFIYAAIARSTLIASLAIIVIYIFVIVKVDLRVKLGIACFSIGFIFLVLMGIDYSADELNSLLSGRIQIWTNTINFNLFENSNPLAIFFGVEEYTVRGFYHLTRERLGFEIQKASADNLYIDILLKFGFLGLIFFLMPIIVIITNLIKFVATTHNQLDKKLVTIVLGVWIGVLLQGTGISVIPSFGNVINIMLLILTSYSISIINRPRLASFRRRLNSPYIKPIPELN